MVIIDKPRQLYSNAPPSTKNEAMNSTRSKGSTLRISQNGKIKYKVKLAQDVVQRISMERAASKSLSRYQNTGSYQTQHSLSLKQSTSAFPSRLTRQASNMTSTTSLSNGTKVKLKSMRLSKQKSKQHISNQDSVRQPRHGMEREENVTKVEKFSMEDVEGDTYGIDSNWGKPSFIESTGNYNTTNPRGTGARNSAFSKGAPSNAPKPYLGASASISSLRSKSKDGKLPIKIQHKDNLFIKTQRMRALKAVSGKHQTTKNKQPAFTSARRSKAGLQSPDKSSDRAMSPTSREINDRYQLQSFDLPPRKARDQPTLLAAQLAHTTSQKIETKAPASESFINNLMSRSSMHNRSSHGPNLLVSQPQASEFKVERTPSASARSPPSKQYLDLNDILNRDQDNQFIDRIDKIQRRSDLQNKSRSSSLSERQNSRIKRIQENNS